MADPINNISTTPGAVFINVPVHATIGFKYDPTDRNPDHESVAVFSKLGSEIKPIGKMTPRDLATKVLAFTGDGIVDVGGLNSVKVMPKLSAMEHSDIIVEGSAILQEGVFTVDARPAGLANMGIRERSNTRSRGQELDITTEKLITQVPYAFNEMTANGTRMVNKQGTRMQFRNPANTNTVIETHGNAFVKFVNRLDNKQPTLFTLDNSESFADIGSRLTAANMNSVLLISDLITGPQKGPLDGKMLWVAQVPPFTRSGTPPMAPITQRIPENNLRDVTKNTEALRLTATKEYVAPAPSPQTNQLVQNLPAGRTPSTTLTSPSATPSASSPLGAKVAPTGATGTGVKELKDAALLSQFSTNLKKIKIMIDGDMKQGWNFVFHIRQDKKDLLEHLKKAYEAGNQIVENKAFDDKNVRTCSEELGALFEKLSDDPKTGQKAEDRSKINRIMCGIIKDEISPTIGTLEIAKAKLGMSGKMTGMVIPTDLPKFSMAHVEDNHIAIPSGSFGDATMLKRA